MSLQASPQTQPAPVKRPVAYSNQDSPDVIGMGTMFSGGDIHQACIPFSMLATCSHINVSVQLENLCLCCEV